MFSIIFNDINIYSKKIYNVFFFESIFSLFDMK